MKEDKSFRRTTCPRTSLTALTGLAACFTGHDALAYLGPGAGLGMIGSLIAILAVALIVILGLLIYPVRLLRKRRMLAAGKRDSVEAGDPQ